MIVGTLAPPPVIRGAGATRAVFNVISDCETASTDFMGFNSSQHSVEAQKDTDSSVNSEQQAAEVLINTLAVDANLRLRRNEFNSLLDSLYQNNTLRLLEEPTEGTFEAWFSLTKAKCDISAEQSFGPTRATTVLFSENLRLKLVVLGTCLRNEQFETVLEFENFLKAILSQYLCATSMVCRGISDDDIGSPPKSNLQNRKLLVKSTAMLSCYRHKSCKLVFDGREKRDKRRCVYCATLLKYNVFSEIFLLFKL